MADLHDDYSLEFGYQSSKRNLVRRKRRGIPDEGDDFVLPPTRGPRGGPSGGMGMSGPSGAGSSSGGMGGMGPGMAGAMMGDPMSMGAGHRHRKQTKPSKGFIASGNFPWQTFLPPNSQGKERRVAQMNAIKLSNMLKLPKAHRWVFYEWFYSNLDRPIFLGENDFRACLRDSFPQLKTRRLTRTQWSMIRRLMGKPRRCSIAFFAEERRTLHEKRDKIRLLQARRSIEGELLRDLPDDMHVPMPLIIGTRVHARCRFPHDGLYSGIVDAIDTLNHSYRVTFDKSSLGTRTVPDYEVLSIEPQETIPLSAYKAQHKASRNLFMSPARLLAQSAIQGVRQHLQHARQSAGLADVGVSDCPLCQSDSAMMTSPFKSTPLVGPADPVLGSGAAGRPQLLLNESDTYGGYPMKFLVMVTKLSKILEVKKRCVEELRVLNEEAEKKISTQESISLDFQHNYATVIVQLDKLNKELKQYLEHVLQYANEDGGLSKGTPSFNTILSETNRRTTDSCELSSAGNHIELKTSDKNGSKSNVPAEKKLFSSDDKRIVEAEEDENVFLLRGTSSAPNCDLSEQSSVTKEMNCEQSELSAPIINSGCVSEPFHAVNSTNCVDPVPLPPPAHHHPVEESFGFFLSELESTAGPEDGPGPMLSDAIGPSAVKEESFTIAQEDRNGIANVGVGVNEYGVSGPGDSVEPAYATLASAVPVSYYHHLGTPPGATPVSTPMHQMYNSWGAAAAAMNAGFDPLTHYMMPGATSPAVGAAALSYGFYPGNSTTLSSSSYYGSLPLPTPPNYHHSIGQEHGVQPLEQTTDIKQRCDDEAYELVTRTKNVQGHRLRNLKNLDLITKLTGMLVQIRTLAENKASPFEFSCIQESLRDLKSAIHSTNIHSYENNVETHVNHILSGLSQLGNLNAFQYSHPPSVAQLL